MRLFVNFKSAIYTKKTAAVVTAAVRKRLTTAAALVEAEAKRLVSNASPSAPGSPPGVISGNLRSSIKWQFVGPLTVAVGPGRDAPYGKFLEFGTRKMAARPFMRPAYNRSVRKFPQIFKGLI